MASRRHQYVVFEREQVPEGAMVAEWRTGLPASAWIDANRVNIFHQVRGGIQEHDLDDLRRTLLVDGKISIIQPPTIGLFGLRSAQRYIEDLNKCWGTEYAYKDCSLLPANNHLRMGAVIAGHRRLMASILLAVDISGDPAPELWLPVQYQINPSFYKGLQTQFQENSHRHVPLWREADSIAATVRWGRETGRLGSYTEVASYLGVTTERVSNAVSFDALPDKIKDRVRGGSLTQESAILLERIASAIGLTMLDGIIADEELATFRTRLYRRQLRADELRPYIRSAALEQDWESRIHPELTRLLVHEDKSKYVTSRSSEIAGDGQLFTMEVIDPTHDQAKRLLEMRRLIQKDMLAALRILLAAITSDFQRIQFAVENPARVEESGLLLTPAIANSPNSRNTWQEITSEMENVLRYGSADTEIYSAMDRLTGLFASLYAEASIEQVVADRRNDFIALLEGIRNIIRLDGASLAGIGRELDSIVALLQQKTRDSVVHEDTLL